MLAWEGNGCPFRAGFQLPNFPRKQMAMEEEEREEIWSWGAGTDGQLATGRLEDDHSPHLLHFPSAAVSSISCGGAHAIALTSCGNVYTWGRGTSGQLGHGDSANCLLPKVVNALRSFFISNASAGWSHSGFVSDSGHLFTCGDGSFGQLGHGDYQSYRSPTKVSFFDSKPVSQIACGMRHSLVLVKGSGSSDDQIYGFGSGKRGQLGVSKDKIKSLGVPQLCLGFEGNRISSICANGDHSSAISSNGQLFNWGRGFNGAPDAYSPSRLCSPLSFTQVALGWNHALLLTGDGETFMLGRGLHGESTDHQDTITAHRVSESAAPKLWRVPGLEEIKAVQIAAGAEHSAVVTDNGEIRTWGWGEHGQLGLGDTRDQTCPQVVHLGNKPVKGSLIPNVYCGSGFTFVVRKTPHCSH